MATPVTNWGKATVSVGYGAGDTTIVLTTGHGSRFPSTFPYPLTWWNVTDYPDPADDPNREIVTVTNRVGDTLTVTRGAESSGASTKNTGSKTYKMILGLTKAMWDGLSDLGISEVFRGLTLQTHPDADVDDKKVQLLHADAIVMDDGVEIATWDDVVADITVAGAGGLDTGTEQASTWYEIYAIHDGTNKKLLLHRAKDYFLDEDVTAGEDATQGCRSNVDNSTVKIAQGLKVDTAGLLEVFDAKLIKVGAPTGNFWFTIEADNAGVPSNTPLATTDKYDVSLVPTTAVLARIIFRAPATLSAATQYHLVLQGDWAVSGTNYLGWRMDGTAGAYANGAMALFDSDTSTWTTDTDDDLIFKAYITRNDTAVTMPTGYTKKALLEHVFNNASSNFNPFHAQDRRVTFLGDRQVGDYTTTTIGVLTDISAFIPPRPVIALIGTSHDTAGGTTSTSPVGSGYVGASQPGTGVNGTLVFVNGVTGLLNVQNGPGPLHTLYQALYAQVGSGTGRVRCLGYHW